jgi:tripartite-type tricarboxylate transporter receptor subunit TctC
LRLRRFHLALATLACALAAAAGTASAQEYPTRPVEIIVPFAAGGGTDLIARLMCEGLSQRLGQSFVAVNRPGANTNVGTLAAIHARPDGHTLLMASIGLAANPSLYTKLGFDPQRDLVPIALIANVPTILVISNAVPTDTGARALPSLVGYIKARPGELNYASYGVGSGPHLAAELFQSVTGTRIVHVPYGGGGPAALGVIGNTVQMLFSSVVPVLGMVRGGSVKAIAIASERRLALLPEVPTFKESGVDYATGTWFGILAPAKTPPPIVARLHSVIEDMLRDPAIRAKLTDQGAEVADLSAAGFAEFLRDESARLSSVIRRANIQLD